MQSAWADFLCENGESERRLSWSSRGLFNFFISGWNADNFVVFFDSENPPDGEGIVWGRMSDSGVIPRMHGLRNPEMKFGDGTLGGLGHSMGAS
jgi:hypothetical protein